MSHLERPFAGFGRLLLGVLALAALGSARADPTAPNIPYSLPVQLPGAVQSPPVDPRAPYTPTVASLIRQLEPGPLPSAQSIRAAAGLLDGQTGVDPNCHNQAQVATITVTSPRIAPLCFTDGLGINVLDGPNVNRTTGMASMVVLAASFDLKLANAMGQMEGREGRNLMTTGLLGPQVDTDVFINWSRGLHTPGEDPWLNGMISAAEVNGIQGQGMMAQVKHFAFYNGNADGKLTQIQDQALHEIILPPYEMALTGTHGASSVMCSYAVTQDLSHDLPGPRRLLAKPSPFGNSETRTAALNEVHNACDQPLLLTYVLRDLWHASGFVGTDYGAVHTADDFLEGADREDPESAYYGAKNPPANSLFDTSAQCADAQGNAESCTTPGARHVAGIPGPGCPTTGCSVANAVINGTVPLALFNQSLARVLDQEERFGLLGCDAIHADCANPGGVNGIRTGLAPLPDGPTSGVPVPGTRNGDAAIIEKVAEEGAVLLKNQNAALPITAADLAGGIAVSGGGAEYLLANPTNEGALGFAERNAINPLQQLEALSGQPAAFTYTPANAPTGQVPNCTLLSGQNPQGAVPSDSCGADAGLSLAVDNQPPTLDSHPDHTVGSPAGQLTGGHVYRWSGWLYVPAADRYVFRLQHSKSMADDLVSFSLDGVKNTLSDASSFYAGQYYGNQPVEVGTTNAGYVEAGLVNRQCDVAAAARRGGMGGGPPPPGGAGGPPPAGAPPGDASIAARMAKVAPVVHVNCSTAPSVGWHQIAITLDATRIPANSRISLRFAVSRAHGDIQDAAAAAKGKALAIVFVNDHDRNAINPMPGAKNSYNVSSLPADQQELINAVAAVNPNTVVVLNTGTPIVVKEWIDNPNVKSLLNMWLTGQEGGTATARLLLGQANPGGHTTITWPRNNEDTIETYNQPNGLYAGDTPGTHPERANGGPDQSMIETQGIYSGYRFYDQLRIPVQFPFGYGLSYSGFQFGGLNISPQPDGTMKVAFDVTNTSRVPGAEVAQVYVGAGQPIAGVQQAVRALRGFARVDLAAGATQHIVVTLDKRSFEYWNEASQAWHIAAGSREIWVGDADSVAHLPLSQNINVAAQ